MSNFYTSSPGLNKSKNNTHQLNTIELERKKNEISNFENQNSNENFGGESSQDFHQGNQQMSMGQQPSIYPGQVQSMYAQQQQPIIPGQSYGSSMPGPLQQGNQPPILPNIDNAKMLENDIAAIINIFKGVKIIFF